MLDTNWQKLYEAAILEINPDKLVTRIGAAEQAIAQREPLLDITELERHQARSELCFRKASSLLHGTRYGRKDVIGVTADQTNRADDND